MRQNKPEVSLNLPFISVVWLGEEDDGGDGDQAASLPASLHLLQQPGDGGHRDVAGVGGGAGRPAGLPESRLERDAPDAGLGLGVGLVSGAAGTEREQSQS